MSLSPSPLPWRQQRYSSLNIPRAYKQLYLCIYVFSLFHKRRLPGILFCVFVPLTECLSDCLWRPSLPYLHTHVMLLFPSWCPMAGHLGCFLFLWLFQPIQKQNKTLVHMTPWRYRRWSSGDTPGGGVAALAGRYRGRWQRPSSLAPSSLCSHWLPREPTCAQLRQQSCCHLIGGKQRLLRGSICISFLKSEAEHFLYLVVQSYLYVLSVYSLFIPFSTFPLHY